jgi:hypothetical protein
MTYYFSDNEAERAKRQIGVGSAITEGASPGYGNPDENILAIDLNKVTLTLERDGYHVRPKSGTRVAPPRPEGRNLDEWFDWYHAMKDSGLRCTLRDVATGAHYAYGTVKQEHMRYMDERKDEPKT